MAKYLIEPVIGGGQITTTTIPLATAVAPGTQYFDTAVGTGTLFTSDGISWNQLNPIRLLAQSGIPFIMPSSGTFSAAGALSALTALDQTYANCYLFFPANAIATVSAAGFYFAQMSSTTAGTVFNNLYVSGTPTVPAASALVACTTASSYTQTTAANITAITVTVPANALGVNGKIKVTVLEQNFNSAGAKTLGIQFGGSANGLSYAPTTNRGASIIREFYNRGVTNGQVTPVSGNFGTGLSAGVSTIISRDTTTASDITILMQLAVATDWIGIDAFTVEIYPQ